ncbi:MAG: NAD(P)(+) transhydrogenase (Re/Si-specific) subunit beta [Candidatus Thiodiazotropha sp. (ex Ustalcina ferruginea)]|nr:NAD(P)(+) transhydrogenase (Re/Si-specific) subunit beta [Candidatus Thiodiazotropha sp. (ex Ustalcina ferruginea)]
MQITSMPELVAIMHSFVGLAAAILKCIVPDWLSSV